MALPCQLCPLSTTSAPASPSLSSTAEDSFVTSSYCCHCYPHCRREGTAHVLGTALWCFKLKVTYQLSPWITLQTNPFLFGMLSPFLCPNCQNKISFLHLQREVKLHLSLISWLPIISALFCWTLAHLLLSTTCSLPIIWKKSHLQISSAIIFFSSLTPAAPYSSLLSSVSSPQVLPT